MGIKAPAFLGDVKSFFFLRKEGSEVSTPCNAQGHPVPITRYWNYPLKRIDYRDMTNIVASYVHDVELYVYADSV